MTFRVILCVENPVGGEEQFSSGIYEVKSIQDLTSRAQGQVVGLIDRNKMIIESFLKAKE